MTDSCPRCLRRDVPPASCCRRGVETVYVYRCSCGQEWTTARMTTAYPPGEAA